MSHKFFQEFSMNFNKEQTMNNNDNNYVTNSIVIDIANNLEYMRDIMSKYISNKLTTIDRVTHSWLEYLVRNNITISNFINSEDFIKEHFKMDNVKSSNHDNE